MATWSWNMIMLIFQLSEYTLYEILIMGVLVYIENEFKIV